MNKVQIKILLISVIASIFLTACSDRQNRGTAVGREHRLFHDNNRINWADDNSPRPMAATIWYPAAKNSKEQAWEIGIFKAGYNALNAEIQPGNQKMPLIVMSHGTGGAAMQLSWLAEELASNGYVVAAINHHGNTAAEESYLPQGFVLWWERATDLSLLIDHVLADPKLGARIDAQKIAAAGFSLGGYTVLSLAGAITDLEQKKPILHSATV